MNHPAFPSLHPSNECMYQESGMTLRDYFAAAALAGFLSSYAGAPDPDTIRSAKSAYRFADAMLKAREQ